MTLRLVALQLHIASYGSQASCSGGIAGLKARLSHLAQMACDSALSWTPEAASLVAEGPLRRPRLNTKRPSAATKSTTARLHPTATPIVWPKSRPDDADSDAGGGDTKIPPPSPSGKPLLLLSVAVRRGGSGSRPAHSAVRRRRVTERTKGESGGKAGEGCRRTVRGDRHVYTLHVVPPVIHGVPEPLEHAVVARLTLRNLHQNGLVAGVDLPELF